MYLKKDNRTYFSAVNVTTLELDQSLSSRTHLFSAPTSGKNIRHVCLALDSCAGGRGRRRDVWEGVGGPVSDDNSGGTLKVNITVLSVSVSQVASHQPDSPF